jgi:hypothetical protein
MSKQRMAGEDLFAKLQQQIQKDSQENQRMVSIMDRQRRRDMAAAQGRIIPFSDADII